VKPTAAMLGLLIGLVHVVPATACHRFARWYYPTPQRCGVFPRMVSPRPPRAPVLHPILAHGADDIRSVVSIPLPDMSANWGGAYDTELELSLQRQKAIRQLVLPAE
jgi:hypothetical protein